ncbi:MAG: LysM peptidoglycan-binding domain-containing protein [Chloroflexota bacterium]|nr:LysM peptidoglycan-binding domain-containing protein [Chloroflexota bacterium]
MKSKQWIVFLLAAVLVLGLVACTRSKNPTAASVTEPTPTQVGGVEPTTSEVLDYLNEFVTQTAAAAQGVTGEQTPQAPTSETPAVPTGESAPSEETPVEPTAAPTATPEPTKEPEPTARTVPTVTPGLPATHTVKSGEHVYCLSRRYNVNPNEMLTINGLASGTILRAGMKLTIPKTGNPFPGNRALKSHPTTYMVKQNETIYTIACDYGDVEPWAIAYANGLSEPYKLKAGQKIYIP